MGWCNFVTLAHRLAAKAFPNGYSLGVVKYYTSRIQKEYLQYNAGEIHRQKLWLDALKWGTNFKVVVVEEYYRKDPQKRRAEKQTDTNIAIGIVRDALTVSAVGPFPAARGRDTASRFEAAILVSADRDFDPAVEMVANEYGKDVASYPRRRSRLAVAKAAYRSTGLHTRILSTAGSPMSSKGPEPHQLLGTNINCSKRRAGGTDRASNGSTRMSIAIILRNVANLASGARTPKPRLDA